ncbi:MAG: PAS domain S-box protein [Ilumatobacteraceae bacterium]|nr:PAS domain S-box protein [Ilumatobacteraceae bacterium]
MTAVLEELLSSVLDNTVDAVLMTDDDGVIVYVNSSLMRLFGYTDDDDDSPIGARIGALLPDADEMDVEGRRVDGSMFAVDVQVRVLPDAPFVVATVRDMSAQRQTVVDNAIDRIDLANARARIEQLQESLDLVIQRLFALGTSIMASASNEDELTHRMDTAVQALDDVINAVQRGRQSRGAELVPTRDLGPW